MNPIDILISASLALIMFGIGASLKPKDFRNVFLYPKALVLGLVLQMLFLPLFAWVITLCIDLNPFLKAGLFIIALCPGGTTSNFISYIVNAEVALSISLTTINSILILFTIPFFTTVGLSYYLGDAQAVALPVGETVLQVFSITLLPAILGVIFNSFFPETSMRFQKPLKYINMLLLGLVFSIKIFAGEAQGGSGITMQEIFAILPAALVLNIGSILISYFLSKMIGLLNRQAVTIGIEVGLQNTTLALLVTGTLLANNEMTKPALVFSIFTFFSTFAFAWLAKD